MNDHIWHENGTQLAWVHNGEVFSAATKQKVALVRGDKVLSLEGESLNLFLQPSGLVRGQKGGTPTVFLKLLEP